jgi:hypothetical protein
MLLHSGEKRKWFCRREKEEREEGVNALSSEFPALLPQGEHLELSTGQARCNGATLRRISNVVLLARKISCK